MDDTGVVIVTLVVLGTVFLVGFGLGAIHVLEGEIHPVMEKCEEKLPRNEFCELTAVPVKS